MKKHSKIKSLAKVMGLSLAVFAFSFSTQAIAKDKAYKKLNKSASFIYGDNLVTDVLPESEVLVSDPTVEQSLDDQITGLSTVMVNPSGDMFESKMKKKDAEIFLKAIQDLEKSGYTSALFSREGAAPTVKPAPLGDTINEVVIGSDNRVQITTTTVNPYYYIGRIAVGCTGTLVGPKHVLTAGHCVADGRGSWFNNLDFTVAQDGSYKPWGYETWTNAYTTTAWFNNRDSNYDYGMIILSAAPHGGYAGYGNYSGGTHTITGYPGDKPFGTMWTHSGSPWTSGSYRICYTIDTAGGQSGSGVRDSGNVVRAIHTTGSPSQNCGTRIISSVYNAIAGWIADNP